MQVGGQRVGLSLSPVCLTQDLLWTFMVVASAVLPVPESAKPLSANIVIFVGMMLA